MVILVPLSVGSAYFVLYESIWKYPNFRQTKKLAMCIMLEIAMIRLGNVRGVLEEEQG